MEYLTQQEIKSRRNKKLTIWFVGTALVLAAVWGVVKLAENSSSPSLGSGSIADVTSADHVLGDINAPVKIVEYADFQCPACAQASPMLNRLIKDYPGRVAVVYRNFPLKTIHSTAVISASAAEAASKQGKFWEMHDLLFSNQSNWANQANADQMFISYAQSLGLDTTQFKSDLYSAAVNDKIEADYKEAGRLQLDHTPTIFINGKEVNSPGSYGGYKQLVEEALK